MYHSLKSIENLFYEEHKINGLEWRPGIAYKNYVNGASRAYQFFTNPFESTIPHIIWYPQDPAGLYENGINPRVKYPNFENLFPHEIGSNWPTNDAKLAFSYFSYAIFYHVKKFLDSEFVVNPLFIGKPNVPIGTLNTDFNRSYTPEGMYISKYDLPIPMIDNAFDLVYTNNESILLYLVQEPKFREFWNRDFYDVKAERSSSFTNQTGDISNELIKGNVLRTMWEKILYGKKNDFSIGTSFRGITREIYDEYSAVGTAGQYSIGGTPKITKVLHKYRNSQINLPNSGYTDWFFARVLIQEAGEGVYDATGQIFYKPHKIIQLSYNLISKYSNGRRIMPPIIHLEPFYGGLDDSAYELFPSGEYYGYNFKKLTVNNGDQYFTCVANEVETTSLMTKIKLDVDDPIQKVVVFQDGTQARILLKEGEYVYIEGDHTNQPEQKIKIYLYSTVQIPGKWLDSPLEDFELSINVDKNSVVFNNTNTDGIVNAVYDYTHKGVENFAKLFYNVFIKVIFDEINNLKITFPKNSWTTVAYDNGIWGINSNGEIKK